MFANYDYTEFPEVKVTFDGVINDENDFTLFIDQWRKLYEDQMNKKKLYWENHKYSSIYFA